jgi:nucleoside-diphosphate-sugar epimerase
MTSPPLPELIETEPQLDALLAEPTDDLVQLMSNLDGDIIILGVAGKMGVSLAQLAASAIAAAGVEKTVYGVARFSQPGVRQQLDNLGITTIACDLLDRTQVANLPQVRNILFLAGRKFGTSGSQSLTWAMNTLVPANVGEHFQASRIVAFSTGCVYPLTPTDSPPDESVPAAPIGEYSQSCLGRERAFEYYCESRETPVCIYRLNYAIDLRYGVLHDIAVKIWQEEAVDNSVEAFNVIWQGDANRQALLCLEHCTVPANIMNVTGPEILQTESVAKQLGRLLNKPVRFTGNPGRLSYLSDSSKAAQLFGSPRVPAEQLINWQAHWLKIDGRSLNKPTHFEVNDGDF